MFTASLTQQAFLACVLEATARKPGNVHPQAGFDDLTYGDFVRSASASSPVFAQAVERGVGPTVLEAIRLTQDAVGRNTNLGIVLLLAPLACVPSHLSLKEGIADVLAGLTQVDADAVYAAIRLANPGGLGRVDQEDLSSAPTVTLLEAMRLAADRDQIAAQYASNFSTVFAGVDRLARYRAFETRWEEAIIDLHLWLMAEFPDTLIARKCGQDVALESSQRARAVLAARTANGEFDPQSLQTLDAWLRADGNRRNPGTSADLVAGCLFAAFRDRVLPPPALPTVARDFLESGAAPCRSR